jgi:hypothetical protein
MAVLPITATQVASHVRRKFADRERGALLFEDTPEAGLVLVVFGNDGYHLDKRVGREVELVREWLTAAGAREQDFGVSPDGHSWAMLVRVDDPGYRTLTGRAFYAELVRAEVEEEVGRAWVAVCRANGRTASDRRGGAGRRAG